MKVTVGDWEQVPLYGTRGPLVRKPRSHQIYLEADEVKQVLEMKAVFAARNETKKGDLVKTDDEKYMFWTGTAKDLGDLGLFDLMTEASSQIRALIDAANS